MWLGLWGGDEMMGQVCDETGREFAGHIGHGMESQVS